MQTRSFLALFLVVFALGGRNDETWIFGWHLALGDWDDDNEKSEKRGSPTRACGSG